VNKNPEGFSSPGSIADACGFLAGHRGNRLRGNYFGLFTKRNLPQKRLEHLEIRFLTIWGLVFQQDGSPAPKDQQDADVTRPFSAATLQYPAVSNIFKLDTVDR
jgi:hypothetical protein